MALSIGVDAVRIAFAPRVIPDVGERELKFKLSAISRVRRSRPWRLRLTFQRADARLRFWIKARLFAK